MHADLQGALSAKGNGRDGKPTLNFNTHSPLQINNPTASMHLHTQRHTHPRMRAYTAAYTHKQWKISIGNLRCKHLRLQKWFCTIYQCKMSTLWKSLNYFFSPSTFSESLLLSILSPKYVDNIQMSSRCTLVEPCVWIGPPSSIDSTIRTYWGSPVIASPLGQRRPPSLSLWRAFDLCVARKRRDEMKWDDER